MPADLLQFSSMAKHRWNYPSGQAATTAIADDEQLRATKRSVEVDTVTHAIETICLQNYMSKSEAAAFLLIDQNREPAFTETVWEELERQNPEFFRAYKIRLALKDQIAKFNMLVASLRDVMVENLQNGTTSGSLPAGDPTCSTSAHVSNTSNMQPNMYPSTSGMHPWLPENQMPVHAVNSVPIHGPMMDESIGMHQRIPNGGDFDFAARMHHQGMINNGFVQNGLNFPTRMQHQGFISNPFVQNSHFHPPLVDVHPRAAMHRGMMHRPFAHNGIVHGPAMVNLYHRMHHNGMVHAPRMHQQPVVKVVVPFNGNGCAPETDVSARMLNGPLNHGAYPFQAAPNHPFDARMPHYDAHPQNGTMFQMSDKTMIDLLQRCAHPPQPNNFALDDVLVDNFPELSPELHDLSVMNDLTNDFHATQGGASRNSDYSYQNPA